MHLLWNIWVQEVSATTTPWQSLSQQNEQSAFPNRMNSLTSESSLALGTSRRTLISKRALTSSKPFSFLNLVSRWHFRRDSIYLPSRSSPRMRLPVSALPLLALSTTRADCHVLLPSTVIPRSRKTTSLVPNLTRFQNWTEIYNINPLLILWWMSQDCCTRRIGSCSRTSHGKTSLRKFSRWTLKHGKSSAFPTCNSGTPRLGSTSVVTRMRKRPLYKDLNCRCALFRSCTSHLKTRIFVLYSSTCAAIVSVVFYQIH